ncbi:MAG: restriction endonuclease subunit S [Candidatus Puniceispirillum sp.]
MVGPNSLKNDLPALPKEWSWVSIGECLDFKNGLNKAKRFFGYGKPIINYMDVFKFSGLYASQIKGKVDVDANELRSFEVKRGDVLFTRTSETVDEVGISCAVLDQVSDTVFSGFVLRGRPKNNKLNDLFKKYVFSSALVRKQITSKATYTTRALTNGRVLSNVLIPVPDCEKEQQAIAEALSDADALIASLETLIEKNQWLKASVISQLIGQNQSKSKHTFSHWQTLTIEDAATLKSGSAITAKDIFSQGSFPCYGANGLRGYSKTNTHDGNFVLIGRVGANCGNIHAVKGKFFASEHALVCTPKAGVDASFLAEVLKTLQLNKYSESSAQPVLSAENLYKLSLKMPVDINLQKSIAQQIDSFDLKIDSLLKTLDKSKKVKAGMMQELLTGRTRLI